MATATRWLTTFFTDVCSGISFRREGLEALLEFAFARRLRVVPTAHQDRFCHFAYGLLKWLFEKYGTEIIVEADNAHPPEGELATDVITVFGARLYGYWSRRQCQEDEGGGRTGAVYHEEPTGGGSRVSNSLGENVPNACSGKGAAALLRSGSLVLQRGGECGKKRGRPSKQRPALEQNHGRSTARAQTGVCEDTQAGYQASGRGVCHKRAEEGEEPSPPIQGWIPII